MCPNILIDPRNYSGTYDVRLQPGNVPVTPRLNGRDGPVTLDLALSRHTIHIDHGSGFPFTVTGAGCVATSETQGLEQIAGGLGFSTVSIEFVTRKYKGTYKISSVDENEDKGPRHAVVLRDLVQTDYDAGYIFYFAPSCAFYFNVDKDGKPGLNSHNRGAAKPQQNALLLNTTDVLIEPDGHNVAWKVTSVESQHQAGSRSVTLVPHVKRYIINSATNSHGTFDVAEDGTPSPPVVVISSGGRDLRFKLGK